MLRGKQFALELGSLILAAGCANSSQAPTRPISGDTTRQADASVQEIFDYLSWFTAQDPRADTNHDGVITVQDLMDFLAYYFGTSVRQGADCSDGIDNDGDGLIDSPFDPDCLASGHESGQVATGKGSYAIKHGPLVGDGFAASYNLSTPIFYDPNVIYPWVAYYEQPASMNAVNAKNYLDQLPIKAVFSWTMEFANDNHNFFMDEDNCRTSAGVLTSYRCPFMNAYLERVRARTQRFASDFHAAGVNIDTFSFDTEALGDFTEANLDLRTAIKSDPRFRQVNTNFEDYDFLRGSMADVLGTFDPAFTGSTCGGQPCQHYWGMFIKDWLNQYMNRALYDPFHAQYPNAIVTNFATTSYNFHSFMVPIYSAVTDCITGAYCEGQPIFGNAQQPGLMYDLNVAGSGSWMPDGHKLFMRTDFNSLKTNIFFARVAALSNPQSPIAPLFAGSGLTAQASRDIYSEAVFHTLLAGAPFLHFWQNAFLPDEHTKLGTALREFDKIAGFEGRRSLLSEDTRWINGMRRGDGSSWYDDYILTGIETAGRKVWRFTPDEYPANSLEPALTVASSLISENPLRFKTRQVIIEFPQGKLWHPQNAASSDGYWIVQPLRAAAPIVRPDDSNTPPIARFTLSQSNQLDYYVLFDATQSSDPDGQIIYYSWDFDGDGIYGDLVYAGDGGSISNDELNRRNVASWFFYLYHRPESSVGLRVTDNQGAVSEARSEPFTFRSARCAEQYCPLISATTY